MIETTMRQPREVVLRYIALLAPVAFIIVSGVLAFDRLWGHDLTFLTGMAVGLVTAPVLVDLRKWLWKIAARPKRRER